jgi:hypothetical protein
MARLRGGSGPPRRLRARNTARLFARSINDTRSVVTVRLTCSAFWVDVRLREINGRRIASADTPGGPSLGLGLEAREAIEQALEPFEGIVDELLAWLPVGS